MAAAWAIWLAGCGGGGSPEAPDLALTQTPSSLLATLPVSSKDALSWSTTVTLPAAVDDGRALGTLFSMTDAQGVTLAAAGLLHGVQSSVSLPKRQISFFLGHNDDPASVFTRKQAGRSGPFSDDSLFSMAVFRNHLLAFRYHQPGQVRVFDPVTDTWGDFNDPALPHDASHAVRNLQTVANHLLVTYDNRLLWAGRPLEFTAPAMQDVAMFYLSAYNDSVLRLGVIHRSADASSDASDAVLTANVVECRWTPPGREVSHCVVLAMPSRGVDSMSQLLYGMHALPDGPVVAFGLDGDFVSSHGSSFHSLRTVQAGESWQVYATTDFEDRVLLGHYPSGGVLEMRATGVDRTAWGMASASLTDEPEVRRDEVQSLVPFGGDVLAGVWPWGEIFRGHPDRGWSRFIDAFSRAGGVPDAGHPYDDAGVSNCLGQRVFQILPWGRGFVYSTTMKNNDAECAGALSRLPADQRAEYGRVVVVERSNALSCALVWTGEAVNLTFGVTADQRMVIRQDGRDLCTGPVSGPEVAARLVQWQAAQKGAAVAGAAGLFGPARH